MTSKTIPQNIDLPVPHLANIDWAKGDGDGGIDGPIKTGNTAKDGSGTVNTIFVAGADGGMVHRVVYNPTGVNDATVLRIFIRTNAASPGVDDNILRREIPLPAITAADLLAPVERSVAINLMLPPGWKLVCTIHDTIVGGWRVLAEGGNY